MSAENNVKIIVQNYPDALDNRNKLVGLLKDYYQELAVVNLFMMIYDSGIVGELRNCISIDSIELNKYSKLISKNYYVPEHIVVNGLLLWADALDVSIDIDYKTLVSLLEPHQNNSSNTKNTGYSRNNNEGDIEYEILDEKMVIFSGKVGKKVSAYYKIKNIGNTSFTIQKPTIEYIDDSGRMIDADTYCNCIPEIIKPGETGFVYSYHHKINDGDLSNGCKCRLHFKTTYKEPYSVEISDVIFKFGPLGVEVKARATNISRKNTGLFRLGTVFYNKSDEVMGFCYTLTSVDADDSEIIEMHGSALSDEYIYDDIKRVEVLV